MDETNEELLAIQLHTAIAKRATVNLSTLTSEESWADLSVMKPQVSTSI
jgi:DNA repair protein RadC